MKTYGEYCAAAKALDIVGDRWSLLIVRELSIRGPCRYSDLRAGLPGIATNLLAERLRELEDAGVLLREEAPPPIATNVFTLSARGRELEGVLRTLAAWGMPLLLRPAKDDAIRAHWLVLPVRLYLRDTMPDKPPITLVIRLGDEALTIDAGTGQVATRLGAAPAAHATISGSPQLIVSVISGSMTLSDATAWGLGFEGDPAALVRLQPRAAGISGAGFALQQQLL